MEQMEDSPDIHAHAGSDVGEQSLGVLLVLYLCSPWIFVNGSNHTKTLIQC